MGHVPEEVKNLHGAASWQHDLAQRWLMAWKHHPEWLQLTHTEPLLVTKIHISYTLLCTFVYLCVYAHMCIWAAVPAQGTGVHSTGIPGAPRDCFSFSQLSSHVLCTNLHEAAPTQVSCCYRWSLILCCESQGSPAALVDANHIWQPFGLVSCSQVGPGLQHIVTGEDDTSTTHTSPLHGTSPPKEPVPPARLSVLSLTVWKHARKKKEVYIPALNFLSIFIFPECQRNKDLKI